jgi:hypothetical protein
MKQSKPEAASRETRAAHNGVILPPSQSFDFQRRPAMSTSRPGKAPSGKEGFLARCIAAIRALLAELTSAYRPERHYMRGGGTGGVA